MTEPRITVTVGTNVRSWVEFEIKDATDEEIAVLGDLDSDAALALVRELTDADRLVELGTDFEDAPDYFADVNDPSVVDLTTGEQE